MNIKLIKSNLNLEKRFDALRIQVLDDRRRQIEVLQSKLIRHNFSSVVLWLAVLRRFNRDILLGFCALGLTGDEEMARFDSKNKPKSLC